MTGLDLTSAEIVDLTQTLDAATATWPGEAGVCVTTTAAVDPDGYLSRHVSMPEHVGTHVDAPGHMIAGGITVDRIPPDRLVRPVCVVDARDAVGTDPDAVVGVDVIERSEAHHGGIRRGDVVLVRTGWDRHTGDVDAYIGTEAPRCPGIGIEAAEHIVRCGAAGIGIDTMSVERGDSPDFPVHMLTLGAGLWHVEGLVGLGRLPARGAWIVVAPLRLSGGSGAPARALALVPPGTRP